MARSALESLAQILDGLGIEWVLFGALAANRYRAETRLTGDTDLLLADAGGGRASLEEALRSAGWASLRSTPEGSLLRVRHAEHGVADLLFAGTEYERLAIARAHAEPLHEGLTVRVPTPEDVIVFKLIAGRSQDSADVENMLATNRVLDDAYIERWAAAWDVLDRWKQLRRST